MASAFASISAFMPRSARGERFSVSAARRGAWSGGSVVRVVPTSTSFMVSLNANLFDENVSQSASALRMASYLVKAYRSLAGR